MCRGRPDRPSGPNESRACAPMSRMTARICAVSSSVSTSARPPSVVQQMRRHDAQRGAPHNASSRSRSAGNSSSAHNGGSPHAASLTPGGGEHMHPTPAQNARQRQCSRPIETSRRRDGRKRQEAAVSHFPALRPAARWPASARAVSPSQPAVRRKLAQLSGGHTASSTWAATSFRAKFQQVG